MAAQATWHFAVRILVTLAASLAPTLTMAAASADAARPIITRNIPPSFEPNVGQFDAAVKYAAQRSTYRAYLRGDKMALALPTTLQREGDGKASSTGTAAGIEIAMVGADAAAGAIAGALLAERSNYLFGPDTSQWVTDVPHYDSVTFKSVYPGIDLRYHAEQGKLEYDFVLAEHADPSLLRMRVSGANAVKLNAQGDLEIATTAGTITQRKPLLYQQGRDKTNLVDAGYRLLANGDIGFSLGRSYDPKRPLVIDPIIDFGSAFGGGIAAAGGTVDASGNTYLYGATTWETFPTVNPFEAKFPGSVVGGSMIPSAFVTKLSPLGDAVIYSTYVGGSGGAAITAAQLDASGALYIAGQAGNGFPTTQGAYLSNDHAPPVDPLVSIHGYIYWDSSIGLAFAAKLNAAGNGLDYATYIGGGRINAVALDSKGAIYLGGTANNAPWPTTLGAFQASFPAGSTHSAGFLAKLAADGKSLAYSTFFGGAGGDTSVAGVAVDASGSAYATGATNSTALPTRNAFQPAKHSGYDAWVAKFASDGSAILYASYLGGDGTSCTNGDDYGTAIAVDGSGSAYVAGRTFAETHFPVTFGRSFPIGFGDAFVSKISPDGTTLQTSVLLGGYDGADDVACGSAESYGETPATITVQADGSVFVAGYGANATVDDPTKSFPLVDPVATSGSGFVTLIDPDFKSYRFSTVVPGITTAASNAFGDIYGIGALQSGKFLSNAAASVPLTPGALQSSDPGGNVAYVARIIRPGARLAIKVPTDPVTTGSDLALRVDLFGIGEAGVVQFFDGNDLLGSVNVADNATTASWQTKAGEVGWHRFRARLMTPLVPNGVQSGFGYVSVIAADCN